MLRSSSGSLQELWNRKVTHMLMAMLGKLLLWLQVYQWNHPFLLLCLLVQAISLTQLQGLLYALHPVWWIRTWRLTLAVSFKIATILVNWVIRFRICDNLLWLLFQQLLYHSYAFEACFSNSFSLIDCQSYIKQNPEVKILK